MSHFDLPRPPLFTREDWCWLAVLALSLVGRLL